MPKKWTREGALKTYIKEQKKSDHILRYQELQKTVPRSVVEKFFVNFSKLKKVAYKECPKAFGHKKELRNKAPKRSQEDRLNCYIQMIEDIGKIPTVSEMKANGYSREVFRYYKGGMKKIEQDARDKRPDLFSDQSISTLKTKRHQVRTNKKLKNHNRFVVVNAVTGCEVDEDFYKAIKNYCRRKNALLVILLSSDPAKGKDSLGNERVDKSLINDEDVILISDSSLNSNIHLRTIKLTAKQIDATTGMDRIASLGTFVYASPKQRLKPIPVGNTKYVHLLITTGAITKADYTTNMYMSKRTEYLADFDHKVGGLVIEIENNKIYHHRHIQADEDGSFIDMGVRYRPNGKTKKERPISIWPGDWHTGDTCPMVRACIKDMIKRLKPKYLFLNDFFNGHSVNHHIKGNITELAKLAKKGRLNLEQELELCAQELEDMNSWGHEKTYVVYSNHDDFLTRYLEEARYAKPDQAQNHELSLDLAKAHLGGENPIEHFIKDMYKMKKPEKVHFLKEDEDTFLAGILHNIHGHRGPNGSRATSLQTLERCYHKVNLGHNHGSEILRDTWRAGTSTYLKLGYNKGPSTWSNSHIHTYENGARQMIYTIDGRYCLDFGKVY